MEQEFQTDTFTKTYVTNWDELSESMQNNCLNNGWFALKEEAQNQLDTLIQNYQNTVHVYKAIETKTGNNYYLDPDNTTILVEKGGSGTVDMTMDNQSVKGQIKIHKIGEVFVSTEQNEDKDAKFIYETISLSGAKYEVKAAEDIKDPSDGSVLHKKGTLVDTITTDSKGLAISKKLPLGIYTIQEVQAPNGFVLDSKAYTVTLEYQGQEQEIVIQSVEKVNNRPTLQTQMKKTTRNTKSIQK